MEKKLFLASMLLLLVIVLAFEQKQNPTWAKYQKEYFAQQAAVLQSHLKHTEDTQIRSEIQKEINSWEERAPEVVNLVLPDGQVERCKTCHIGIEEISPSHPSNTIGCTICHGGNALSLDEQVAHANMLGQGHPGSLAVVSQSCGTSLNGEACHSQNSDPANNEADLVKTSLMSTKAGELSSVRMMLGLDPHIDVPNLKKGEAAGDYPEPLGGRAQEKTFQENCLSSCHLNGGNLPNLPPTSSPNLSIHQQGNEANSASQNQANGCESCHVLTNPSHTYLGGDTTMQGQKGYGLVHELTTQIPYTQCNQCHNEGQHDPVHFKFTYRSDLLKVVEDWMKGDTTGAGRLTDYYVPGEVFAGCEVSLDCIDCHTRQDVMGDNKLWTSEYDAVHIQCQDCHGTTLTLPRPKVIVNQDDPAFEEKITSSVFPELKVSEQILVTEKGEEMPFIRYEGNEWNLYSRVDGKKYSIPLAKGSACQQDPVDQGADSCHKCHSESNLHQ